MRLWRIVRLALALAACMSRFAWRRLRGPLSHVERALWLQSACRGVLRALHLHYTVSGLPPSAGLVASNHLSYLDILFYSAAMPCCFVSKAEVNRWPYFGAAAPVFAAAIRYLPSAGAPESTLCWFGDEGFFRNLWRTLAAPPFLAEITFACPAFYSDRRQAADTSHRLIDRMRRSSCVQSSTLQVASN